MKILITGGLGYIGSHIAHLLGKNAIVIDNKVNSSLNYKKKLPYTIVYKLDLNARSLNKIFLKHNISGVIHLAGLKSVNESMSSSLKYYKNNLGSSMELLESMDKHRINKLIFSSSATVYGDQNKSPLNENMKLKGVNPYGNTKILIEKLIEDYSNNNLNFKSISLRYFNPIGANLKAELRDQPIGKPQNLMPLLIDSIKNKKIFSVFGCNYPTKDGTCIRDYIHVQDLALAHILAFKKLSNLKGHTAINLGLGKGASVLEIIKIFEKINNVRINYKIVNRRKGDVAITYADNRKAKKILGWKPKHNYEDMVRDAWLSTLNNKI